MTKGRIVKISQNTTFVLSKETIISFPFKTKHNLYDIIDENDNLIVRSYKKIDFEKSLLYL
ncbi:MAG: hypothetical protein AB7E28_04735, partial [Desulfurella sp.]